MREWVSRMQTEAAGRKAGDAKGLSGTATDKKRSRKGDIKRLARIIDIVQRILDMSGECDAKCKGLKDLYCPECGFCLCQKHAQAHINTKKHSVILAADYSVMVANVKKAKLKRSFSQYEAALLELEQFNQLKTRTEALLQESEKRNVKDRAALQSELTLLVSRLDPLTKRCTQFIEAYKNVLRGVAPGRQPPHPGHRVDPKKDVEDAKAMSQLSFQTCEPQKELSTLLKWEARLSERVPAVESTPQHQVPPPKKVTPETISMMVMQYQKQLSDLQGKIKEHEKTAQDLKENQTKETKKLKTLKDESNNAEKEKQASEISRKAALTNSRVEDAKLKALTKTVEDAQTTIQDLKLTETTLSTGNNKLETTHKIQHKLNQDLKQSIREKEVRLAQQQDTIVELGVLITKKHQEAAIAAKTVKFTQEETTRLQNRHLDILNKLQVVNNELKEVSKGVETLRQTKEELLKEIQDMKQDRDVLKLEIVVFNAAIAENRELKTIIFALHKELQQLQNQKAELERTITQLKEEFSTTTTILRDNQNQLKTVKTEFTQLQANIEELKQTTAAVVTTQQNTINILKADTKKLECERTKLQTEVSGLGETKQALEKHILTLRQDTNEKDAKHKDLIKQIQELQQKRARLLQNTYRTLQTWAKRIKDLHTVQNTFRKSANDGVQKYKSIIHALKVSLVARATKTSEECTAQAEERDLLHAQLAKLRDSVKITEATIQEKQSKLSELQNKLKEIQDKIGIARRDFALATQEKDTTLSTVQHVKEENNQVWKELEAQKESLAKVVTDIKARNKEREDAQARLGKLQRDCTTKQQECTTTKQELERVQRERDAAAAQLKQDQSASAKCQEECAKTQSWASEMRVKIKQMLPGIKSCVSTLRKATANFRKDATDYYQARQTVSSQTLKAIKTKLNEAGTKRQQLARQTDDRLHALRLELAAMTGTKDQLTEAYAALVTKYSKMLSTIQSYKQGLTAAQQQIVGEAEKRKAVLNQTLLKIKEKTQAHGTALKAANKAEMAEFIKLHTRPATSEREVQTLLPPPVRQDRAVSAAIENLHPDVVPAVVQNLTLEVQKLKKDNEDLTKRVEEANTQRESLSAMISTKDRLTEAYAALVKKCSGVLATIKSSKQGLATVQQQMAVEAANRKELIQKTLLKVEEKIQAHCTALKAAHNAEIEKLTKLQTPPATSTQEMQTGPPSAKQDQAVSASMEPHQPSVVPPVAQDLASEVQKLKQENEELAKRAEDANAAREELATMKTVKAQLTKHCSDILATIQTKKQALIKAQDEIAQQLTNKKEFIDSALQKLMSKTKECCTVLRAQHKAEIDNLTTAMKAQHQEELKNLTKPRTGSTISEITTLTIPPSTKQSQPVPDPHPSPDSNVLLSPTQALTLERDRLKKENEDLAKRVEEATNTQRESLSAMTSTQDRLTQAYAALVTKCSGILATIQSYKQGLTTAQQQTVEEAANRKALLNQTLVQIKEKTQGYCTALKAAHNAELKTLAKPRTAITISELTILTIPSSTKQFQPEPDPKSSPDSIVVPSPTQDLTIEQDRLKKENEELPKRVEEANRSVAALNQQIEQLTKERGDLNTRIEDQKKENDLRGNKINQLTQHMTHIQQLISARQQAEKGLHDAILQLAQNNKTKMRTILTNNKTKIVTLLQRISRSVAQDKRPIKIGQTLAGENLDDEPEQDKQPSVIDNVAKEKEPGIQKLGQIQSNILAIIRSVVQKQKTSIASVRKVCADNKQQWLAAQEQRKKMIASWKELAVRNLGQLNTLRGNYAKVQSDIAEQQKMLAQNNETQGRTDREIAEKKNEVSKLQEDIKQMQVALTERQEKQPVMDPQTIAKIEALEKEKAQLAREADDRLHSLRQELVAMTSTKDRLTEAFAALVTKYNKMLSTIESYKQGLTTAQQQIVGEAENRKSLLNKPLMKIKEKTQEYCAALKAAHNAEMAEFKKLHTPPATSERDVETIPPPAVGQDRAVSTAIENLHPDVVPPVVQNLTSEVQKLQKENEELTKRVAEANTQRESLLAMTNTEARLAQAFAALVTKNNDMLSTIQSYKQGLTMAQQQIVGEAENRKSLLNQTLVKIKEKTQGYCAALKAAHTAEIEKLTKLQTPPATSTQEIQTGPPSAKQDQAVSASIEPPQPSVASPVAQDLTLEVQRLQKENEELLKCVEANRSVAALNQQIEQSTKESGILRQSITEQKKVQQDLQHNIEELNKIQQKLRESIKNVITRQQDIVGLARKAAQDKKQKLPSNIQKRKAMLLSAKMKMQTLMTKVKPIQQENAKLHQENGKLQQQLAEMEAKMREQSRNQQLVMDSQTKANIEALEKEKAQLEAVRKQLHEEQQRIAKAGLLLRKAQLIVKSRRENTTNCPTTKANQLVAVLTSSLQKQRDQLKAACLNLMKKRLPLQSNNHTRYCVDASAASPSGAHQTSSPKKDIQLNPPKPQEGKVPDDYVLVENLDEETKIEGPAFKEQEYLLQLKGDPTSKFGKGADKALKGVYICRADNQPLLHYAIYPMTNASQLLYLQLEHLSLATQQRGSGPEQYLFFRFLLRCTALKVLDLSGVPLPSKFVVELITLLAGVKHKLKCLLLNDCNLTLADEESKSFVTQLYKTEIVHLSMADCFTSDIISAFGTVETKGAKLQHLHIWHIWIVFRLFASAHASHL